MPKTLKKRMQRSNSLTLHPVYDRFYLILTQNFDKYQN